MNNELSHKAWAEKLQIALFDEQIGSGLSVWLPKGFKVRQNLIDLLRRENDKYQYLEVASPHLSQISLYDRSGHASLYKDKIFMLEDHLVKPMNCPMHILVIQKLLASNAPLPIRVSEFAQVYRNEQSGEVNGLLRARGFMQDDGHVLLRHDQLKAEIHIMIDMAKNVMAKLGLNNYQFRVGLREDGGSYLGDSNVWDDAENALRKACDDAGIEYVESKGDAAFYGPKLDLVVIDRLNREWQMGTIQVDFQLPQLFDLPEYVLVHRAIVGSIERCIGALLEINNGWLPAQLAPVVVQVIPISNLKHLDKAVEIAELLKASIDDSSEPLSKKLARSMDNRVPIQVIVGDKEIESNRYSIRQYGENINDLSLDDIAKL